MTTVRFDLLGPPDLRVDGTGVHVETRKAIAVLARVVVDGPQRRATLDALLWPESDAGRARAALRRTLVALRKALPEGWLADGDDVALAGPVETDLDEVVRLVGDGRATRDVERLRRADELHRGDFLAGLHFRDADPFEHWRRDTAEAVARRHTRLVERSCRVHVDHGRYGRAIEAAQRRLAMDPLHEPSHQQLMLLHAWQGDRAAATRQYAECVRVLDEQLGVAPLPRTAALDRAIRAGSVDPPPAPSPADAPHESVGDAEHDGEAAAEPEAGPDRTAVTLPFVGRDDELVRVLSCYRACGDDGAVVAVVGEAGIGKTRLVTEVVSQVEGPVVRLTARDGESALAYAPVTAALRSIGPVVEQLDERVRVELARLVPDVAGVRQSSEPLTSPAARTRLVDACATALVAALTSGTAPGLLVADDVDRADPATRELVGYLARRLEACSVLLLVTARDPTAPPSAQLRLHLDRLTPAGTRALAEAGGIGADAARLHEESEGVPLLVVSYLAARAARAPGATDWSLPVDARELVRGRVARLSEVDRQVLSAAAVLGDGWTPEVLERVSGRGDEELVVAVETLVATGLLVAEPDGTHGFSHGKIRSVVEDDTSQVRRRLLHRRAADVLAATTPPVAAATLARHLEAGGREHEAAEAHAAAGRRAADLYANSEAVDHLEAAIALGHGDRAGLLLDLGDLQVRTGEYETAAQCYTRAIAHGAGSAVVGHRLGALALRRGHDRDAVEHLTAALDADPSATLRVDVLVELARGLARRGDLDRAMGHAREAVDAAIADGLTGGEVARAHNVAGLVARRRGEHDAARQHLRASLAAATRPDERAAALNNLALVLGEAGELDEALELSREALEAGRTVADRHREAALLNNLADLLHAADRREEALALQAQAAERFSGVGAAPTTTPEIWQLVDW